VKIEFLAELQLQGFLILETKRKRERERETERDRGDERLATHCGYFILPAKFLVCI
jgi:hypothetical protein